MSLEVVVRTLSDAGVEFALVGAFALSARGAGRATFDIDLMTTDRAVLTREFWLPVQKAGIVADIRKGDFDDPLAGVVRFATADPIDLVVAKYRWQQAVISRAERIEVNGVSLPVPRSPDLILLKLFAGGYTDFQDVKRLLDVGPRDQLIAEVTSALESLPEEMRDAWQRLLSESSGPGGR
jgi:predicted nucleotidyltransferase